jgi:hypothetical protein
LGEARERRARHKLSRIAGGTPFLEVISGFTRLRGPDGPLDQITACVMPKVSLTPSRLAHGYAPIPLRTRECPTLL